MSSILVDKFIGIDPSFKGLGLSAISVDGQYVLFDEKSVDVGEGSFAEITKASIEMCKNIDNMKFKNTEIGMEIPPVNGFYAVKLWALDSRIYEHILSQNPSNIWLFNVPYLRFINGKNNTKKDTMKMINSIVEVFKFNDFQIIQTQKDKRGKDRKLTSNQCDSFLYCVRVFIKYCLEHGIFPEIVQDILNINDKFIVEKETSTGKSKKKGE